jgi:hypothetical protein
MAPRSIVGSRQNRERVSRRAEVAIDLHFSAVSAPTARQEGVMGKYVVGWLLGVPLSVLALIYIVSRSGCM